MALFAASGCFLAGLVALFFVPKRGKTAWTAVLLLWGTATAIRTIFLLHK